MQIIFIDDKELKKVIFFRISMFTKLIIQKTYEKGAGKDLGEYRLNRLKGIKLDSKSLGRRSEANFGETSAGFLRLNRLLP
jgi:hypothetical protein